MTKKTKDGDEIRPLDMSETGQRARAPAPSGPEIASVYLLTSVHMARAGTPDGTISPHTDKNHERFQLFDGGRFLEIRARDTDIVRYVPWTHVRHWTPMGAE
ncbi:MAG TPA: hypothetical protein VFH51_10385 [Myxococcota bacterium]|nr:hypothetical protein [Myxococcota bacterium]